MRAVNRHDKLALREAPMLLMEFHGSEAGVAEQAATVQEIASEHGGEDFEWATHARGAHAAVDGAAPRLLRRPADAARLPHRDHRHLRADLAPGRVRASRSVAEAEAAGMPYYIVGHVGDGNFHLAYLIDPNTRASARPPSGSTRPWCSARCALDGTCSGEHGIGLHKMDFLVDEAGAGAIEMMRAIKRALDPKNIMNPGKIFAL